MATRLKIKISEGDIIIRLYDETPQHRDNFLKLAKEIYYPRRVCLSTIFS